MDKKSPPEADQPRAGKIFFIIFGLLIAASVAVTYWRIMVKKDYVVEAQTDCDPTADKCFIWECDPASTVEGEACTGDAEKDTWYYQIARRNAAKIPLCDPDKDENCDPWTCDPATEKDCSTTFCDETNKVEQGVECNDPVQYNIDNPPAEEGDTTCAPDDTECVPDENASPDSAGEDGGTEKGVE